MNRTNKNNELLKNSFFIGVGTVASKLLVFILVPLYSSWLTPEEYGTFDLVVTYITLCVPFVTLQLEQAIYVFCISQKGQSERYYTSAIMLVFPLLCVVSVVVYCVMRFVLELSYAWAFVLYFGSFALFNLTTEYVRGKRKLLTYSVANVSYAVLVVALSSIVVGALRLGLSGMLSVYGCSYLAVALALFIIYRPLKPHLGSAATLKEMVRLSLPLLPNSISWWISNVSNRSFINLYMGSFFNGLFAVSSKVPTIVTLLYGIFNLAFQQAAFDTLDDQGRSLYYRSLFSKLTRILATGCVSIVAVVPLLYWLAIEQEYWEGVHCIPLLLAGTILLSLAQFLGDILLAERKTGCIGRSTVVAAVATIVLNALFVPVLGLQGAALGSFVAYMLMFLLRIWALRDHFAIPETIKSVGAWLVLFGLSSAVVLASSPIKPLYAVCAVTLIGFCFAANKDLSVAVIRKMVEKK